MNTIMTAPGFTDPVHETQKTFRAILDAMARPGFSIPLPVLPPAVPGQCMSRGMLAVALTLCDANTPIWLDKQLNTPEVRHHLRFHCAAPLTEDPRQASFAFISSPVDMPRLHSFPSGEAAYPERSATLVIDTSATGEEGTTTVTVELTGPGIKEDNHEKGLSVSFQAVPDWFFLDWQHNCAAYPLGVDVLFVNETVDDSGLCASLLGLPRSVFIHYPAQHSFTENTVCM